MHWIKKKNRYVTKQHLDLDATLRTPSSSKGTAGHWQAGKVLGVAAHGHFSSRIKQGAKAWGIWCICHCCWQIWQKMAQEVADVEASVGKECQEAGSCMDFPWKHKEAALKNSINATHCDTTAWLLRRRCGTCIIPREKQLDRALALQPCPDHLDLQRNCPMSRCELR